MIVGFGDFLIHFSPIGDERFAQSEFMQMSFTGAEANVCAALSYWDEKTKFVTALPGHSLAKKGISVLKSFGIATENIAKKDGRMGLYYLENGRSFRPSEVIYDRLGSAFTTSCFEDYNWDEIFRDAKILYMSGITPALCENLFECSLKILQEAQKRGIDVFFDINYRPTLCSPEKAAENLKSLLPYITHLIGNEEHIKMLMGITSEFGEDDTEKRIFDVANQVKQHTNLKSIAVTVRRTLSASRTIVYSGYLRDNDFAITRQYDIDIIDRVGSGDAFSAGIIYGNVHGYDVSETVNFAVASNVLKHTITKDINYATVEEIKNLMNSGRCDVKR